jgi:pimeloyl-ACP methyl ester carboxylesterase
VAWSGGKALAKAIPGAKLHVFPGMGHDMPRDLLPRFAEEICDLADRGDQIVGRLDDAKALND